MLPLSSSDDSRGRTCAVRSRRRNPFDMFIRNVECASSSSWTPQDDFVLIAEGEGGGLFVPSGVTPISTGGLSAADTSNSPPRRRQGDDRLAFDRSPPRARSKEDPLDDPSLLGRDIFRGRSSRCHGSEA